jgi:hypothetical protein
MGGRGNKWPTIPGCLSLDSKTCPCEQKECCQQASRNPFKVEKKKKKDKGRKQTALIIVI